MAGKRTKQTPPEPPRRRGPPPYQATDEQRELVRNYVVAGMTAEAIAEALGIGRSTLYREFACELASARNELRAETIAQLRTAASAGNVSAMKALLALCGQPGLAAEVASDKPLGKKAAAALKVLTAGEGSVWSGPYGPGGEWLNDLHHEAAESLGPNFDATDEPRLKN